MRSTLLAVAFASRTAVGQSISAPVALRSIERDSMLLRVAAGDTALLAGAPQVLIVPGWRVLATFAPVMPTISSNVAFANAIAVCQAELPRGVDRLTFAAVHDPWSALDSATVGQPLVVFSVAPRGGLGAPCGDRLIEQPLAAARGLDFVVPGLTSQRNPTSLSLRIGGKAVEPVFIGSAPVVWVRRGDDGATPTRQLRLYVTLDDLAPDTTGLFPSASLDVTTATGAVETITLSDSVVRGIWTQALPWRLERLRQTEAASKPISLPVPGDSQATVPARLLDAGQRIDAALAARGGLESPNADLRRFSRVLIGTSLWAAGDTLASRVILGPALRDEPCLAAFSQANIQVRQAVSGLRGPAPCAPRPMRSVVTRGLLFPGGGQLLVRRNNRVSVATIGIFVGATAVGLASRQKYHDYLNAHSTTEALRYYDSARDLRLAANRIALAGAALWTGAVVDAVWKQSRLNRRLKWLGSYGGTP